MPKKSSSSQSSHLWAIMAAIFVVAIGMFMSNRFASPKLVSTTLGAPSSFDFPQYEFKQLADRTVNSAQDRAAAIWIDSPGGSGTFFYLIGGMQSGSQVVYSEPVPLGDRIKIQSVTVGENTVTVQYLDRPENAPMSDEPGVPTSMTYEFQKDGSLVAQ